MPPVPRTVVADCDEPTALVELPVAPELSGTVAAEPRETALAAEDSDTRGAPTPDAPATATVCAPESAAVVVRFVLRDIDAEPPLLGVAFEGVPPPAARPGFTLLTLGPPEADGTLLIARSLPAGIDPAAC